MLEGLLARFLASRLGKFVDGLDQENLNVALWRGEILLEHLRIKPAAVDEALGLLPLALKWGKVGTFHLSVPWNALGTRPLVITLTDVTFVFRLLNPDEEGLDGDADAGLEAEAARRRRAAKERAVQERLKYLRASGASVGEGGEFTAVRSKSLAERIFASMLETVQIRVSNFHVRIEGGDPEAPFTLPQLPPGTRSRSVSPAKQRRRPATAGAMMAGSVYEESPGMGSVYYHPQAEEEEEEDEDEDEDEEFLEAWEEEPELEAPFEEASEGRVFALGLVLREFTVEGAPEGEGEDEEEDDEEGGVSRVAAALVRKRATATAFAVYCDHKSLPLVVYQTHAHPAALMGAGGPGPGPPPSGSSAPTSPTKASTPPQEEHSYLLQPTSGELSLATRPVPLSPSQPQYDVACRLSRVHVAVTRSQVDRLATITAAFSAFSQWDPEQQRLWRLRPRESAVAAPRAWWRYAKELAMVRHRKERARRLGWPELVYLARTRPRYVALHKRRAAPDLYPPLTLEEAGEVAAIEELLRVEELVYFRALAEAEAAREEAARAQRKGEEPSAVAGWLRSWFSGAAEGGAPGGAPSSSDSAGGPGASSGGGASAGGGDGLLSAEDRRAIEEAAMEYGAALAQASSVPDHFTVHRLALSVNEGSFSLLESRERPIARLMVDAAATLHVRPHSWRLGLAMGALEVLDLDPLTKYRTVVTRKTRARWSASSSASAATAPGSAAKAEKGRGGGGGAAAWPMLVVGDYRVPKNLDLTVEFNPSKAASRRDVAVTCRVLPFEVYYSRRLLEGLGRVVTDPDIEDARQAALRGLRGWRARQQARLLNSMAERQRILLDVEVEAPVVLVPETTRAGAAQLLVLDLGHLVFRNAAGAGAGDGGGNNTGGDEDAWELRMRRMELLMCRAGSAYLERRETAADLHPIVEAFDLDTAVRTRVDPGTRALTHAALEACLPRLCVHLRASTVQYLHRVASRRRAKARAASFRRRQRRRGSRFHAARAAGDGDEEGLAAMQLSLVAPRGQAVEAEAGAAREEEEEGGGVDRVLELQFRAPDIALHLEDDLEMQPLVDAAVQGIDGLICARSSGAEGGTASAEVALEIGGLSLRDRHPFADASFADLLSGTGSGGSVLNLSLRREATREEDATEVDVGLRPLRLQWNPETVLALQRFFSFHTRPQHRPASSSTARAQQQQQQPPNPSPERPPQEAAGSAGAGAGHGLASSFMSPMSASLYFPSNDGSVILALPPGASAGSVATAADAGARRASRFRLGAKLEAVEVLLNKEGELRRLLGLTFSSAALSFEAAAQGDKQLVGTINGLVVTDLGNADTCFPRVLCAPKGADDAALVVQFKYTSLGAAATSGDSSPSKAPTTDEAAAAVAAKAAAPVRADNLLEVDVGPLQVVYFNHLSLEVIDYLCEGVLAALVTGALRSADALVRQRALAKTGFSIRMAQPRCILPRLLSHPDHALATIDSAALTTEFDFQTVRLIGPAGGHGPLGSPRQPPVPPRGDSIEPATEREEAIVLRRFVIGFEGVEIGLVSPRLEDDPPVLEAPLSFVVQVSRPLDVEYGARLAREWDGVELPLHVTAALGPVRLRATHAAYSLLRRVVEDNLLTQRHHAEALLKELRALDLPPLATRQLQQRHERAASLQASSSRAGGPKACPQCATPFRGHEDGAHTCPQCGDRVCRRCLSVSVFDKASGLVVRVCTECARASFPRLFAAGGAMGGPVRTPTPGEAAEAFAPASAQQQRIAYSYGLLDGVLTDIRVDVRLCGLTLDVLEPEEDEKEGDGAWAARARLAIEETRFHFRRPEDDRKVLDVSLYRCTVEALRGAQAGRILCPSLEAAAVASSTDAGPALPPLSIGGQPEERVHAPQFIYRYSSAPDEAPTTHMVLNHLNIVARFGPILHLATFFGRMAEDPLAQPPDTAAEAAAVAGPAVGTPVKPGLLQSPSEGATSTPGSLRPSTSVSSLGTLEATASSSSEAPPSPADAPAIDSSLGGQEPLLEVLRKVKVMVHHPRIIFPEAAVEGAEQHHPQESNAVVVRGLGVGSFVHELERRMDGAVLPRSRWRAQLDGLECFIAPAAGLEDEEAEEGQSRVVGEEDVSLLTPVSLSLEYARAYSPLRSPLRSARLAVEDLVTYVSYRDLSVLARVLESWYRANIGGGHEQAAIEAAAPTPMARGLLPGAAVASTGYYELTFTRTKLGLMLRKVDGLAVVDSLAGAAEDEDGVGAFVGGVVPQKGDAIVSVNGQACGHGEVLQLVRSLTRPITLGFQRRGEQFAVAVSLDEVFLHRSKLPDCLLVSDKSARDGRASAMVVSVEGIPVEGKGYHAALALLQQRAAARPGGDPMVVLGLRQLGQPARITDVELEVAGVSLLAIDDAAGRDLPLVKARAQTLQARIRDVINPPAAAFQDGDARVFSAAVYATLQADYYNGRIGAWEPLLERVGVSGSLRKEGPAAPATAAATGQPGAITSTILDLATTDALCVNVTDAGLELVLRTLAAWRQQQEQQEQQPSELALAATTARVSDTPAKGRAGGSGGTGGATVASRGSTHVFRNLTGLSTAFWTVRQEAASMTAAGGGSNSGQGPILEAAKGASVPFSVERHRGGALLGAEGREARRREYDAVHTLFVRLLPDGDGDEPLQGLELSCLPMTRTGTYTYPLPHAPRRRRHANAVAERVIWEVTAEDGRRVLTLRSALRLANSSGVRLQLRCGGEEKEDDMLEVGPWATASLPLSWAGRKGPITLRPLEEEEEEEEGASAGAPLYDWSGPLWDDPDAAFGPADALRTVAVCPTADPKRKPLMLHLEAAVEDEEGSYTLRIYAGATVVNLLPTAVRYGWRVAPALRGQSAQAEEKGRLESGEERGLPCADVLGLGAELAFRLDGPAYEGLGWSRWLRMGGAAFGVREVELADEAGNSLVVLADVAARGPHGVTVTLYVDVWIENLTGLGLVYGEPRTAKVVETLAGPVTTDVVLSAVQDAAVVEEVFEVRVVTGPTNATPRVETRWGSELGRPLPNKAHWRLPSAKAWAWADEDWRVDMAGQVDPRGGWESSQLDYPDAFKPGRHFRPRDRIFRRRWTRRRVPVAGRDGGMEDSISAPLLGRTVLPFQPRVRQMAQAGQNQQQQQQQQQAAQQVVIKIGDSGWSVPLDVGMEGAGGAFQLVGNRWPGLPDDPCLCRSLYELTYRVAAAPAPWDRTRILTVQGRYTLHNDGPSALLVGQHGAVSGPGQQLLLKPGEARPFHWPDYRRAALLVVSLPAADKDQAQEQGTEGADMRYLWSGGIDIGAISDLPLVVRPHRPSLPPAVAASAPSRIVRVRVELGGEEGEHDGGTGGGEAAAEVEGAMAVTLAEVPCPRYSLQAPARATKVPSALAAADLPLIWLENRSDLTVYFAQAGAAELEEEGLPPQHMQALGWDHVAAAASATATSASTSDLFGGVEEEEEDPFRVRLTLFPPQSPYRRMTAAYATVSPDAVGSVYTLELPALPSSSSTDAPRGVLVEVTVDGPSKVLRLLNAGSPASSTGRRRALSGSASGRWPADPLETSSGLREVGRRQQEQAGIGDFVFRARVACPALVVSVVDDTPEEVLVLGLADVVLQGALDGATSAGGWKTRLTVGSFQVDNHMARAHFPVVLRPAEDEDAAMGLTAEQAANQPPSIRLDMEIAPPRPSLLLHVRLLRLGLRRLVLNLDQSTALAVQRLQQRMATFSAPSSSSSAVLYGSLYGSLPHTAGHATVGPSTVSRLHAFPLAAAAGQPQQQPDAQQQRQQQQRRREQQRQQQRRKLFIERLRLESLAINLSLSRPRESPDEVYVGLRLNRMMADMMYRLDEARLKLQPFEVGYLMTTPRQIWWLTQAHYSREVKRHIFQMLGSLRALGKPVALIRGFGKGAQDFIAQPLQGLVRSVEELNPDEFVQGVARGADSLVRHTVGGVANSASCITDNLSKQLSNLSFDREYKLQRERREARKEKPADVLEGLGSGGKRLVKGLFDGVTGVVAAPIRGAERGGLKGLVKGVGKGVLGLVVKPVVGIADAATDVLHGVQGTAGAASTADQLLQLRPKRALYGADRRLRAYDPLDAQAQILLAKAARHARGGSDASGTPRGGTAVVQEEFYADYAELGSRGGITLISTARLIVMNEEGDTREIFRLADILFVEAVEAGQKPGAHQTGVILHLHVRIAGGDAVTRRLMVPCETRAHAQTFKYKLDQALLAWQSSAAHAHQQHQHQA